jgi:hypothetical protein
MRGPRPEDGGSDFSLFWELSYLRSLEPAPPPPEESVDRLGVAPGIPGTAQSSSSDALRTDRSDPIRRSSAFRLPGPIPEAPREIERGPTFRRRPRW